MGNLTKPVIGVIGLLSKVMVYWVPDGKQSKLIKAKISPILVWLDRANGTTAVSCLNINGTSLN